MAGTTHTKEKKVSEEEYTYTPQSEGNYLRIPVPAFSLDSLTTPKMFLFLILLSYLLSGYLYMRLHALEGDGSSNIGIPRVVGTSASNVSDAFIDYAKNAKMDTKKFASCLSSHTHADKVTTDVTDGTTSGINATPGFIVNGNVIIGAQPFATFKTIIDQELARTTLQESFALIPKAYAQTPSPSKVTVSTGHLPVLGKKNAKVTIVEFSDFQCPFCKQFFTQTFPEIKKTYIDTGKAKLYFRQYPLTSIHPNAQLAAEASECANDQGKFWEFHDLLFSNQTSWEGLPQTTTSST